MRKLLGLFALGGVSYAVRKFMAKKDAGGIGAVDMDQPQKTVQKAEAAVGGQPIRP